MGSSIIVTPSSQFYCRKYRAGLSSLSWLLLILGFLHDELQLLDLDLWHFIAELLEAVETAVFVYEVEGWR